MTRKRLPEDQEKTRFYVLVTTEVEKAVRQVAVDDGGNLSWAVDTLLREALEMRRIREGNSKALEDFLRRCKE